MGLFGKLAFWKKDEMDFDQLAQKELGSGSDIVPPDNLGIDDKSPFEHPEEPDHAPFAVARSPPTARPSFNQPSSYNQESNRDLELINSKLDTIKAMLLSMEQRMANLERESNPPPRKERLW